MIDKELIPTAGAQELARTHTVAQLRDRMQEEFGVKPPSKAVKIEIAQQLDDLRTNATPKPDMTGHWAEQGANVELVETGEPQVFQGAMHEAGEDLIGRLMREATGERLATEAVDQVITEELSDLAPTLSDLAKGMAGVAQALNTAWLATQAAARKLTAVAWSHQVVVVRSMGRTVRGKVIDTVLRTPGADGMGRVCLVVEHPNGAPGRKPTRTLHALADVKFEALAS